MLNDVKEMLAVSINDMILRAMEPADLLRELTEQLEHHAVALRTEAARAIAAENRLRAIVEAGQTAAGPQLARAASLASEQRELLDQVETRIAEAKLQAQRLTADLSVNDSRVASQGISRQFKKLDDYLNSL